MRRISETDLKRDFEKILPLIDIGESVIITRNGKDFMRLDPASNVPRMEPTVSHAR